jgi:hypothetical protein
MNEKDTLFFPTRNGYCFIPEIDKHGSSVLAMLKPSGSFAHNTKGVSTLICNAWVIRHKYVPLSSHKVYIVGITSHGIKNEVHRGSHSAWGVTRITKRKTRISSESERSILREMLGSFRMAISNDSYCPDFHKAFLQFVVDDIGINAIEEQLSEIENKIAADPLLQAPTGS